jgi:uroporphyrinogen-III synthase
VTDRWVLATRTDEELAPLAAALRDHGWKVVAYPVLREEPLAAAPIADLDETAAECSLVAFTSRRAPGALHRVAGASWSRIVRLPAAAVGVATAEAAREEGFIVTIVGDAGGEALAVQVARALPRGASVLHPCGREHRAELARGLEAAGIRAAQVVVYGMTETPPELLPALADGRPSAVLLTSPRAAKAYLRLTGASFAGVPHFALGPTTAATVAAAGIAARVLVSTKPEALVEELCPTCV